MGGWRAARGIPGRCPSDSSNGSVSCGAELVGPKITLRGLLVRSFSTEVGAEALKIVTCPLRYGALLGVVTREQRILNGNLRAELRQLFREVFEQRRGRQATIVTQHLA